jgi:hypothetical protein
MKIELSPRQKAGSTVTSTPNGWKLQIPAGSKGTYRLAQLDDYTHIARSKFHWRPPLRVRLRARVSAPELPGTWGFGLWNDPFGISIGYGGTPRRLPSLPETAWFFYGSPPNSLALEDQLPGHGFFAGVFHSTLPGWSVMAGLPALPLLTVRPLSRAMRRLASRFIREQAASIHTEVTSWQEYSIQWLREGLVFQGGGTTVLESSLDPFAPLGLVLWIDNQYASWSPQGEVRVGTLNNPEAWLEIADLQVDLA